MEGEYRYIGIYDYLVIISVLLISSGIGIYYRFTGGKQKTFKEYLLADQEMSIVPVAFSLMASFMSAITILGVSKENYIFGTQFIVINISYIISTPIVCYIFLPVFFQLQKISVYEYLEMRYGKATRRIVSLAFTLQMTLYMGIVLYAPALALAAVTGISQMWSIIVVGLVCTFYSTIGGMKAVLITDVFQSLLMFAAVFAVIAKGIMDFGVVNIFKYASEGERLEFFNLSFDPRVRHTVWSLTIGGVFTYCSLYGVNQAQVQRLLTVRSLKKAQRALWLQWIILTSLSFATCFSGLILYAQYRSCDPQLSNKISNSDQLLPYYVVERLGNIPGLSGLFVSGIFSGSLSTVSSSLNSLSAVTLHDYIMPFAPHLTEHGEAKAATLGKIISVFFGILCVGVSFMAQFLGTGVLQASLTIFGAVGGPILAVFSMGILCRIVNQKGAIFGLLMGLSLTLWIGFGQPKPIPPYKPRTTEGCLAANLTLRGESPSLENETMMEVVQNPFDNGTLSSMKLANISVKEPVETASPEYEYENPLHNLYAISYMWVATIGFCVTVIVGVFVSWATGGNQKVLDRNVLSKYIWKKSAQAMELNGGSFKNEVFKKGKTTEERSQAEI